MSAPASAVQYGISFDGWYGVLSTMVGLLPSASYLRMDDQQVEVRMGWAFRSRFPRSEVESVSELGRKPVSRGVHGFAGRWLVNGSGSGVASIRLRATQRAHVLGFPVRLKLLMVSVADPSALASALGHPLQSPSGGTSPPTRLSG